MPTDPRTRSARSRSGVVGVRPAAIAVAPLRTSAGVFGIARTTGRSGRAPSSVVDRDAGRDREDQRRRSPRVVRRLLEHAGDVAGLHRDDHDVGVGHRPRRAGHDPDTREALLEAAPAVGVDLGDGERVGLPAGVEQAPDEGLAHAPAAEATRKPCMRLRRLRAGRGGGPRNLRAAPYFPERSDRPAPRASPRPAPYDAPPPGRRKLGTAISDEPDVRPGGCASAAEGDGDDRLEPRLDELVEHADDAVELLAR